MFRTPIIRYPIHQLIEDVLTRYAPDLLHDGGRAAPDWACLVIEVHSSTNLLLPDTHIKDFLNKVRPRPQLQSAILQCEQLGVSAGEIAEIIETWEGIL